MDTIELIKEFPDIVVINMYRSILRYAASNNNSINQETKTLLTVLMSEVNIRKLI